MGLDPRTASHTLQGLRQRLTPLLAESKNRVVWLRVGRLIDGTADQVAKDADVLFSADRIMHVGEAGREIPAAVLPPGRKEPDLVMADMTLMPCLIEAHAHLFLDGAPVNFAEREEYLKKSPEWMLERGRARWPGTLQYGIGTVRDAGDNRGVGLALAAEAKKLRGQLATTPWIDSPGSAIHHKGRYGSFMGEVMEDHASPEACVQSRVAKGSDRIKLLVSGIINFKQGKVTTPPQMPIEEVKRLVAEAKRLGKQTFAHASGTDGVENSIEGGVTTVEHGFFVTDDQLAKMRDRGIAWVPTFAPVQVQIDRAPELGWDDLVVGHLKRIIEGHQNMLRKAQDMGVTVVAGSDAGGCGVPHGYGFLQELEQMQRAGMRPMNVLKAATGTSVRVLQFGEQVGRIAAGYRARMILTAHDPTASVANLFKEKTILFDGQVVAGDSTSTDGL